MSFKYLIVFDTNILYVPYDKKADFTQFYFNSTFKNVVDKVEELDIYSNVNVAVPDVVWEEIRDQKIRAYNDRLENIKKSVDKFKFPFHEWQEKKEERDYSTYIDQAILGYKEELRGRQVSIDTLSLPSQSRFSSIVERAFQKRPPFEGKGGQTDKGFKDALLWESILEYKIEHGDIEILFYTKDHMFNEEIIKEYAGLFNGEKIKIFQDDEANLLKSLEEIAKKMDAFVYIPDEKDENQDIKEWIDSDNFKKQIKEHTAALHNVNKYIHFNSIQVLDIYDINREMDDNQLLEQITVSLHVKVIFDVQEVTQIEDIYDMTIDVQLLDGVIFTIEDVFIHEDGDEIE